jgi:pimeloyl-ACP methyl ester carboxylesterase
VAREFFDRQKERWAYLRRSDIANTKLVIFVHGFRGSYLSTWGKLAGYLEANADNHTRLAEWDYLFVGYETYSIGSFLQIARLISSQWESATKGAPPFDLNAYTALSLFGHSLGTLGIRQLLCATSEQPTGMVNALRKVVLVGSPTSGSPLARAGGLGKILDSVATKGASLLPQSYKIADALLPGNPQLEMLKVWNATIRGLGNRPFDPVKVIFGTDDLVLPEQTDWLGDERTVTALDHSSLCKVDDAAPGAQASILDLLKGLPA